MKILGVLYYVFKSNVTSHIRLIDVEKQTRNAGRK